MQSQTQAIGGQVLATRWALLLLCCWLCGHITQAQGADTSGDGPVRVHGVVVNAVTQVPIGRALVTSVDQRMAIRTDDKGRFEFEMRAPSSHDSQLRGQPERRTAYIVARKPGYLAMEPPLPVLLNDQSTLKTEIRLQLMPEATISGLTTTSGTDSPSDLNVQLLRKQVQDGTAVWMQADAKQTDARGRYRFGGLTPGEYKIVTAEWIDRIGPYPVTGGKPVLGFPPQAFPSGSSVATAGIIHLEGGQNVEADINLRSAPYYAVEIPISSRSRLDFVAVTVEGEDDANYSLGFDGRTQLVEGLLPDGVYRLTVSMNPGQSEPGKTANILIGTGNLTVADKPVHESPIKLLPGVTIPITVREEYTGHDPDQQSVASVAAPAADSTASQNTDPPPEPQPLRDPEGKIIHPRAVELFLLPTTGRGNGFGITSSPQDEPGTEGLMLENVSPGSYRVQVNPRRGYAASVAANGINILREPLVIAPEATTSAISIVLRDDVATISGTVSTNSAKEVDPPMPHSVWAFPLGDEDSARFAAGLQNQDGKFTITGVVPGRYLILASKTESLNLEYRNRDVMKTYESKGVIVNVSSGQAINVELKEEITDDSWTETETVD